MDIRLIRNDADHDWALAEIDKLWGAPDNSPERERFEILVALVASYEDRHHPIGPPTPIEAIKFRIEQGGLSRKDLEPMIGSRARVSEVLSGKRPLTLPMIRRLSQGLGISADILAGISPKRSEILKPESETHRWRARSVLLDQKYRKKGTIPRLLVEGIACS